MSLGYVAWLLAAFWVAVGFYRGRDPFGFLAAVVAGAAFAHMGWLALHLHVVAEPMRALVDVTTGYSVLAFPLGVLLFSRRDADAWRALPLALAVARVGCLVSECCAGRPTSWGNHPAPLYEIVLLVLLSQLLGKFPREAAGWAFLLGFGSIRLAVEPLRIPPEAAVPPAVLAGCWVAVALAWAIARARCRGSQRLDGVWGKETFPRVG